MARRYRDCYIAFLDMLGFKALIDRSNCDDIYQVFSKIDLPSDNIVDNDDIIMRMDEIKMKIMSDSICFYIDAKKENALVGLIFTCLLFQAELMNQTPPIMLRGSIVRGELYANADVTFGPGLTKAYLLEEKNAKVPRIIITRETLDSEVSPFMLKYKNQLVFEDEDAYYSINCFGAKSGILDSQINWPRIRKHVDDVLGSTTDSSVREKYLYLRKRLTLSGVTASKI